MADETFIVSSGKRQQEVSIPGGISVNSSGGAVLDGVDSNIKASVLDYTNSNPLAVRLSDTNGDYVSAGAGTQYTEDAAAAADPVGGMLIARRKDTLSATEVSTDGDNIALNATNKGQLHVKLADTVTVDGSGVTQPVSGTVSAAQSGVWTVQPGNTANTTAWKVDASSVAVPVTDNSGSLTVDAPVGTPAFVRLSDGASPISTLPVSLASVPSHAVTNAGTFAVQDSEKLADNAGFTDGTTKVMPAGFIYDEVAGTALTENDIAAPRINANRASVSTIEDGSTRGRYATVSASNALKVDGSAVTQPVSGTVTANAGSGTFAVSLASGATAIAKAEDVASADADVGVPSMAVRKATPANTSGTDGDYEMLQMSAGRLWTSATIDAALPAGANAIGKLAANSGVTIGAVEIAASQTLGTVTTLTTLTGGGIAHDGVDSGNPIKIGYKAETSPKGITLVADGDRTDAYADADGIQMVKLNTSGADLISERVSNTDGASTAFTNFSAVASTKNYITGFHVFRTDAGTTPIYVDFRDGTAGSILWSAVIPPNGGSNSPAYLGPALFKTSANTALAFDVSAATTTVYISVTGYQSKV